MAQPSTIYRFHIDVSDIDRGVYESVDLRIAQHPSESTPHMLTRLVAYALNLQEGLAFSKGGLSQTEDPALFVDDLTGIRHLWIEVGSPSPERLHHASKASKDVRVYVYKQIQPWLNNLAGKKIYQQDKIEAFSIPRPFLQDLERTLTRNNTWAFVSTEGELYLTVGEDTVQGSVTRFTLGG